ncbi:hypothetical protein AVEN_269255-1 [Araneus ventricosus]|uniref:Uncharacterized protein n=1 Tax=Araneus ventricosus TaxID=182803 RepID=A0A4Y2J7S3_ARAVE|nr:hypothetical protein AVEN_269255-1 [Araneus ventricosus]
MSLLDRISRQLHKIALKFTCRHSRHPIENIPPRKVTARIHSLLETTFLIRDICHTSPADLPEDLIKSLFSQFACLSHSAKRLWSKLSFS